MDKNQERLENLKKNISDIDRKIEKLQLQKQLLEMALKSREKVND